MPSWNRKPSHCIYLQKTVSVDVDDRTISHELATYISFELTFVLKHGHVRVQIKKLPLRTANEKCDNRGKDKIRFINCSSS